MDLARPEGMGAAHACVLVRARAHAHTQCAICSTLVAVCLAPNLAAGLADREGGVVPVLTGAAP